MTHLHLPYLSICPTICCRYLEEEEEEAYMQEDMAVASAKGAAGAESGAGRQIEEKVPVVSCGAEGDGPWFPLKIDHRVMGAATLAPPPPPEPVGEAGCLTLCTITQLFACQPVVVPPLAMTLRRRARWTLQHGAWRWSVLPRGSASPSTQTQRTGGRTWRRCSRTQRWVWCHVRQMGSGVKLHYRWLMREAVLVSLQASGAPYWGHVVGGNINSGPPLDQTNIAPPFSPCYSSPFNP